MCSQKVIGKTVDSPLGTLASPGQMYRERSADGDSSEDWHRLPGKSNSTERLNRKIPKKTMSLQLEVESQEFGTQLAK